MAGCSTEEAVEYERCTPLSVGLKNLGAEDCGKRVSCPCKLKSCQTPPPVPGRHCLSLPPSLGDRDALSNQALVGASLSIPVFWEVDTAVVCGTRWASLESVFSFIPSHVAAVLCLAPERQLKSASAGLGAQLWGRSRRTRRVPPFPCSWKDPVCS